MHDAVTCLPRDSAMIFMGHHPIEWLREFDRPDVDFMIQKHGIAYLHGHMHSPRPTVLATIEGSTIRTQAGALYQGRQRYNGYTWLSIDIDTRHTEFRLRSYFDTRRVFAVDVAPEGTYYSSPAARSFWARVP